MTEVPEHLLKRSRDRRAALGLGGGDAGDAAPAPAADTPATPAPAAAAPAAAAAPVVEAPKPPPFVPPYIKASEARKRIPLWVMPVLAFLPVWAVIYAQTLSQPPSTTVTQLEAGAAVYATYCSACHGGSGEGGPGRVLADGEVVETFPNIVDHLEWINLGTTGYTDGYGNPERVGGQHTPLSYSGSPMTGFHGTLTDAQVLEVARHERETLSGEEGDLVNEDAEGNLLWPNGSPFLDASGTLVWDDGEPMFDDDGKLTQDVDSSKTIFDLFPA